MKYLVGIVAYNPNIIEIKNKLTLLREKEYNVIIVDNSSKNINILKETSKNFDTFLIENSENMGIAFALNQIFEFAEKKKFEWVLTLDQDSDISDSLLETFSMCPMNNQVGVYCPKVYDIISRTFVQNGKAETNRKKYSEIDKCITSGSLTSVKTWKEIGGFDNYLFIDEVDNDFCYRLKKDGYHILIISDAIMNHQIGKTRVLTLLGRKVFIRNHSAMRKFYITRNRLYLDKKYYGHIKVRTVLMTIMFIVKTLIFENEKLDKFLASNKGIIYAIRGK